MKKTYRKIACIAICLSIIFGLTTISLQANEKEEIYFLTFDSPDANQYVKDHIGEFLNSESKINPIDLDKVSIGAGIYVEDFDEGNSLPMFYYPIYIENSLSYVFRVYDDGNGEYTGIFSVGYVDSITQFGSRTPENAILFGQNHGNEIAINSDFSYQVINQSMYGESVDDQEIEMLQKQKSISLMPMNIHAKEIEFVKYPNTRAYSVLTITYPENQGREQWCLGFTTTSAIRFLSGNQNITTYGMGNYFGIPTTQGFTWAQVRSYCNLYGVSFIGPYSGVIATDNILNEILSWDLVLGCYETGSWKHAFLIHGVDGNQIRFWNPWNTYSEWGASSAKISSRGYDWTMYGYGMYRQ